MTREVIVAPPRLLVVDAWRVLEQQHIRHLPITESGKLVGIVSDRDFLRAGETNSDGDLVFPKQTVAEIMSMKPIVCSSTCSVVTSTDLLLLLLAHAPTLPLPFDFRVRDAELAA